MRHTVSSHLILCRTLHYTTFLDSNLTEKETEVESVWLPHCKLQRGAIQTLDRDWYPHKFHCQASYFWLRIQLVISR